MEQALILGVALCQTKTLCQSHQNELCSLSVWGDSSAVGKCPASAPGGLGNDADSKSHGLGGQELFRLKGWCSQAGCAAQTLILSCSWGSSSIWMH